MFTKRPPVGNVARRESSARGTHGNAFSQSPTPDITARNLENGSLSPQDVLMLQRVIGNYATQQVIQRLTLKNYQGKKTLFPKKTWGVLGIGGTNFRSQYARLYKFIESCNKFAEYTPATRDTIAKMRAHYTNIIAEATALRVALREASSANNEGEKEKEAEPVSDNQADTLLANLLAEARVEQSHLFRALYVTPIYDQPPTWLNALHELVTPNRLQNEQIKDQVGGEVNQLVMIGEDALSGFFKRNIERIPHFLALAKMRERDEKSFKALLKEYQFPVEIKPDKFMDILGVAVAAGIIPESIKEYIGPFPPGDGQLATDIEEQGGNSLVNLARRDVATSRLNALLHAGVIAHAEMALLDMGERIVEGSLMQKARGEDADEFLKDPAQEKINPRDPDLVQLLSRLELVDALARQVDRHRKNYFIEVNESGKVISVTGIDNDMSFGEGTDVEKPIHNYAGISLYVDAKLATAILRLDPALVEMAMHDLLSSGEIEALQIRLEKLKAVLRDKEAAGQLLSDGEWGDEHIDDLLAVSSNAENAGLYRQHFGKLALLNNKEKEKVRDDAPSTSGWSISPIKARERGDFLGKGKEKEKEKELDDAPSTSGWSWSTYRQGKGNEEQERRGDFLKRDHSENKEKEKEKEK